ncbi:Endoribonuclease YbeY [Candidatus Hodgkinia cicadicola]|nr:Endoribonuclease YbeY [Candidatus Hodgkinia cicadicola]
MLIFEIRCEQWLRSRSKLITVTKCLVNALARSPTAQRQLKVVFIKRGKARVANQTIWIGWRVRRRAHWWAAHAALHALGLTDIDAEGATSMLARQRQFLRLWHRFPGLHTTNAGFN